MEIPRFKLGKEYSQYFNKFVPAMELCEDGDFVKYHELERLQEELENVIAEKEKIIEEIWNKDELNIISEAV